MKSAIAAAFIVGTALWPAVDAPAEPPAGAGASCAGPVRFKGIMVAQDDALQELKEAGIVPADLHRITIAEFRPRDCADNAAVANAYNRQEISEFLNAPAGSYPGIDRTELTKAWAAIQLWPCTDDERRWITESKTDYENSTATCDLSI